MGYEAPVLMLAIKYRLICRLPARAVVKVVIDVVGQPGSKT